MSVQEFVDNDELRTLFLDDDDDDVCSQAVILFVLPTLLSRERCMKGEMYINNNIFLHFYSGL